MRRFCSAQGILTRRRAAPALRTGHLPPFEKFCAGQLERIDRITDRQVRHVREVRQQLATRAIAKAGTELELRIRGSVGSDAHPDDDAGTPLV